MVFYGPWGQRDDFETYVGERLPGLGMDDEFDTPMGPDRNRPWDDELNEALGTDEHKPWERTESLGFYANFGAGGSVTVGDLGPDSNWIEEMHTTAFGQGEQFAVAHDFPEGEGTDFDLRSAGSISPFEWPPGAIGYEWEDGEGISTVVGCRWVVRIRDTIIRNSHATTGYGPDGSTSTTIRIYANGALGEHVLASYEVAEHNALHEFEFDLTDDMTDEFGTVDVYPSVQRFGLWWLIDPMTAGAPDWPTLLIGASEGDDELYYTLRPPRHRFIYETQPTPIPCRLYPTDHRFRPNARIFPPSKSRYGGKPTGYA